MPYELLAQYLKLPVFGMVAARLAGMIAFQPLLSALAVPMQLRALLVVGLAALMTPLVDVNAATPDTPAQIAIALLTEMLLGVLIGLVGMLAFVGLQMGAMLIAQESGVAFGQLVDPTTAEEQTVISTLYLQLGIVVYLIVGGHRALLGACLDTFHTLPLLSTPDLSAAGVELLVNALAVGTQMAIRVAAPTVVTMFLINIALGFIARTVPQLNVVFLGFSLKGLVGFALMAVSLPAVLEVFAEGLETLVASLESLTKG